MAGQSLPLWGRWHGEAVTEEGSTYSPKGMQFGKIVPQPLQSKIKDFCQLPQRGSLGRCRAIALNFNLSQIISFAKLLPGVWYSTPSKSVMVAAMSAKLGRVPRLTGFTFGPSTSRGTYSRVWSVVAV